MTVKGYILPVMSFIRRLDLNKLMQNSANQDGFRLQTMSSGGGQGLPRVLSGQLSEMWNAACMSFYLCPMLSAGVVHAPSRHEQINKSRHIYLVLSAVVGPELCS